MVPESAVSAGAGCGVCKALSHVVGVKIAPVLGVLPTSAQPSGLVC